MTIAMGKEVIFAYYTYCRRDSLTAFLLAHSLRKLPWRVYIYTCFFFVKRVFGNQHRQLVSPPMAGSTIPAADGPVPPLLKGIVVEHENIRKASFGTGTIICNGCVENGQICGQDPERTGIQVAGPEGEKS